MNKAMFITILLISVACARVQAQRSTDDEQTGRRRVDLLDVALSTASGRFSAAASWTRLHDVGAKRRLQLGYGLRLTSFVAANKFYTTAPAKYTSTRQDITTIFSETIDANIDTLTTATAVTYSLNATLNAQYRLTSRWDIGFTIDLVGFGFGPEKKFNIISSSFDSNQPPVQAGKPTQFNLLLTSDNDIGSLNSEFFVRYWVTAAIGIRVGYTFLFSEYRTRQELSFDNGRIVNDRYRYKAGMALVAVTYKPFN
jgi:hypothetical protein